MFHALRSWRRKRVLATSAIPDELWSEARAALPLLARYDDAEIARLRELTVLFLDAKGILGAQGHEVTPSQRVIIAVQACVPILNLDLSWYDGFENVIVYPGEFVTGSEWEDEAGVVHRNDAPLAGEAMDKGPVVLSWPDVEAARDWHATGMNLVIHEFAHKLDLRDGTANGCPPLPEDLPTAMWRATLDAAYTDFVARVDDGEETPIDPYAAEDAGEFFAVLSEVFFAEPTLLLGEYPAVYALLARFYRQDLAGRSKLGGLA
ncbi:MAG TPA: M90 family metallopeptidase [Casimicrobiaceae bacterium]|nr:M90 family metallopeptidase [Casimicrobiaceae bacterium]